MRDVCPSRNVSVVSRRDQTVRNRARASKRSASMTPPPPHRWMLFRSSTVSNDDIVPTFADTRCVASLYAV